MGSQVVDAVHDTAAYGAPDFAAVVVLLAAAVIAVTLFRRLGLGSVLGSLVRMMKESVSFSSAPDRIIRASMTSDASRSAFMDQPTARRENRSRIEP
ncbi:hypothetical protein EOJ32_08125 [Paracoccus sp. Arc7-R13]|nr:hypothetical protein EOJ32_08125 [Paracoccus sp. Arc7-R13]TNC03565.1 hypothetical protein FHD68_07995 [Paracoccus marcusii]